MKYSVSLFGGAGTAWSNLGTALVEVGVRRVPQVIFVEVPGDDRNPDLEMKIEVRHGVPVYTSVSLVSRADGPDIRDKDLRNLFLDDWLAQIVAEFTFDGDGQTLVKDVNRRTALKNVEQVRKGRSRKPGNHLPRVAEVYRDNIKGRPTEAVSRAFGVSHRTATRYVREARDAGLLSKHTTPGQKKA